MRPKLKNWATRRPGRAVLGRWQHQSACNKRADIPSISLLYTPCGLHEVVQRFPRSLSEDSFRETKPAT